MSNYYLIARKVDTNSFKIIELKSKWYLKNGNDILKRANSLEAIDLVTTRFKDSDEMTARLFEKGQIEYGKYDFFIVSKYKKDNEEKLRVQEVIFNAKEERINDFRQISYSSLNNKLKDNPKNIRLFDKFITKVYYDKNDFNKVISTGLSALPRKVVELCYTIKNSNTVPYNLKYKNAWMMDNYGISRSIIDLLNRYDNLKSISEHVKYFNELNNQRSLIKNDLLKVCDKNYVKGQVSLFDNKDASNVEDLGLEDKKNYVLKTLKKIELSIFENIEGKTIINPYKLNVSFTKEEEKTLVSGLNKRLLYATYLYNFHNEKLKNNNLGYGEYSVLEEDINADLKEIRNYLKSESTVNKAYLFCTTYNKLKTKSCSSWDVKTYQKK